MMAIKQVGAGPGQGDQGHVAAGIMQVADIHRHWFGPAEEEAGEEKGRQRHDDRTDGVDVLEGIEGHPAQHARRAVAQVAGRPAMGGLVHRDGEQHRQHHDGQDLNVIENIHGGIITVSPGAGWSWMPGRARINHPPNTTLAR
jgi:hypothetical protein